MDNDCWWAYTNYEAMENEEEPAIDDESVESIGSGYGSGHCYGGDILQALAKLQGVTVESV